MISHHIIEEEKRRTIRILLAEDDPANQKLALVLLKKADLSVDIAENGQTAIAALKHAAYDLVLMSLQLPGMDGLEAIRAIREMEGDRKHTPIIAMTDDRELCLLAGMDDYISKPIKPQTLSQTIEKWVKPSDKKVETSPEARLIKEDESGDAPVDIEDALQRFDGDKEFLSQLLQEFVESSPQLLQTLKESVEKNDQKKLEMEAHSLKGAAGNLSAKCIANLAYQLELWGRKANLSGAAELIGNLETEFERLKKYTNQSLFRKAKVEI